MNQAWENGKKKLISGPILARLTQIWAKQLFLCVWLQIVVKHCSNLSS